MKAIPQDHVCVLSHEESKMIGQAIEGLANPISSPFNLETFKNRCFEGAMTIPTSIKRACYEVASATPTPVLLIKNLPVDSDLPLSPMDGNWQNQKQTFISEASLFSVAQLIGTPYGINLERDGHFIDQVCASKSVPSNAQTSAARGSLHWHTELPGYPSLRPDVICLMCLRGDPSVYTLVSSINELEAQLKQHEIAILREPIFRFRLSGSFHKDQKIEQFAPAQPVIKGPSGSLGLVAAFNGVHCEHSEGLKALERLKELIDLPENQYGISLEPGDLLLVSNRNSLHSKIVLGKPRPTDGKHRWLQRTYVKISMFEHRDIFDSTKQLLIA